MDRISFPEAHANLKAVMDKVAADRAPIVIARGRGRQGVVLVPVKQWASIKETFYLLRSPRNAEVLLESIRGLEAGEGEEHVDG